MGLVVATEASASPCPTNNVVTDPADVAWTNYGDHYGATIEMSAATFTIGSDTLTTRAYGQAGSAPSIPAPTMRLQPGAKYVVRFHNKLPYEAPSPDHQGPPREPLALAMGRKRRLSSLVFPGPAGPNLPRRCVRS